MTVRALRLLTLAMCGALSVSCAPASRDLTGGSSDTGGQGGRAYGAGGMSSGTGGSMSFSLPSVCSGSGYACMVPKCSTPAGTTVRGTVYDPAGKNPVYGAMVYFPDQVDSLGTISSGPGNLCGRCVRPNGNPVAGAVSGPDGSFVITQAPAGKQIPIVVQLGKWRRMTMVESIEACADNIVLDVRLPRSRSDGQKVSLPRMAIAAGAGDRVQCLLRRIGVDTSEFTNPDGLGAVNIYNQPSALGADPTGRYDTGINGGVAFPEAATFWSDINQLGKYDLVVLSCGGNATAADPTRTTPNPITDAAKTSMVKYLSSGGRVLGEHYNSAWIRSFPAKSGQQTNNGVPSPLGADVASWYAAVETSDATSSAVPVGTTAVGQVDVSFAKGKDFADWLVAAKATQTVGTFPLKGDVKRTAIDQLATTPSAQRWLYQPTSATDLQGAASYTHFLSFNMTSGGQLIDRRSTDSTNLCGRFVYTGLHVDSAETGTHASDLDDVSKALPFPSCCAQGDLSPQEKAIEFMLFDLSSCLSLDADGAAGGVVL
jgi:hypothetical protein